MKYEWLDMERYPRKAHFDYFRSLPYPYDGITCEVDVTELVRFCKERKCSFYLAFLYVASRSADTVPEFRQRIRDGGIVQYDACGTSHVELLEDDTFCYCTLYHDKPWAEFLPYAENARRECRLRATIEEDENVEGFYFISTIPWLHYTNLTQAVACGNESNPRISWGKFQPDFRGRMMLPLTVLVHHALVDGFHIGRFFAAVDTELAKLINTDKE